MRDIEEGGWIIPHFILGRVCSRFPPDSRGMCMGMLCSDISGISMKEGLGYIRIPKISKILCKYRLTIRVAWGILLLR